ncbi:hypothetical protein RHMOL_Rhmol01G0211100 [Rhododendron molle]|uniref:Uncharacterized protein n=1 Tax=Rhododendron molle TaxID=49168 RepID=A0ACC0Q557_RHOML|nr:hypothetical protein RHMOL_Rhmol01G0211100 [Rhododendron molle]
MMVTHAITNSGSAIPVSQPSGGGGDGSYLDAEDDDVTFSREQEEAREAMDAGRCGAVVQREAIHLHSIRLHLLQPLSPDPAVTPPSFIGMKK